MSRHEDLPKWSTRLRGVLRLLLCRVTHSEWGGWVQGTELGAAADEMCVTWVVGTEIWLPADTPPSLKVQKWLGPHCSHSVSLVRSKVQYMYSKFHYSELWSNLLLLEFTFQLAGWPP